MPSGSYQIRCALASEDELVSQGRSDPFESRALQPCSPDDDRISEGWRVGCDRPRPTPPASSRISRQTSSASASAKLTPRPSSIEDHHSERISRGDCGRPAPQRPRKADVMKHPEAFDHVGLLVDEPPGEAGLPFNPSSENITSYLHK